jgi:nucleoside phosphorylase
MAPSVSDYPSFGDEDDAQFVSSLASDFYNDQESASNETPAEPVENLPAVDRTTLEKYFGDLSAFRGGYLKRKMTRDLARRYDIDIAENIPDDKTDAFQRYREIPLHAIFLYTTQDGAVGDYIKRNWAALDHLSEDLCDIYNCKEQYQKNEDAYTLIETLDVIRESGFSALDALPGLFFWDSQDHCAYVGFGIASDHLAITKLLRELFVHIKRDPTIATIRAWLEERGLDPLPRVSEAQQHPVSLIVSNRKTRPQQEKHHQSPSRVDISVIIPLKEEFAVFQQYAPVQTQAIFDKKSGQRFYQFNYSASRKGLTYVCLVGFADQMGPTDMVFFTQSMLSQRRPQTLVMLGIAGSMDEDVRLGDVVLATEVASYLESGKVQEGQYPGTTELLFGSRSYDCNSELSQAVQHFQFVEEKRHNAWMQQGADYLQKTLDEASRRELLDSQALRPAPRLQTGTLASGPLVIASTALKKDLRKQLRGVKAVEMEAAGMMHALKKMDDPVDSLILRGISDFGDEQKNHLEKGTGGQMRSYAMHNASKLFWQLLDAGIFPKHQGD